MESELSYYCLLFECDGTDVAERRVLHGRSVIALDAVEAIGARLLPCAVLPAMMSLEPQSRGEVSTTELSHTSPEQLMLLVTPDDPPVTRPG